MPFTLFWYSYFNYDDDDDDDDDDKDDDDDFITAKSTREMALYLFTFYVWAPSFLN